MAEYDPAPEQITSPDGTPIAWWRGASGSAVGEDRRPSRPVVR